MMPRLLLIAQDGPALDAYRTTVEPLEAQCDIVASLGDARAALLEKEYHGLLIDGLTMTGSRDEEKSRIEQILPHFPAVQLDFEPRAGGVQAVSPANPSDQPVDLAQFVGQRCASTQPRRIRRFDRAPYHLNLVLSRDELFTPDRSERANTIDISEGGCFVHTVRTWRPGEGLWVQSVELLDQTPIAGTVMRCVPWGTRRILPGIGIRFDRITSGQLSELRILVERRRA